MTRFLTLSVLGVNRFHCVLSNEVEGKCASGDRSEALEASGPSYRIGLSGANKRMLHLLKKAKVQLIKIDQQKQLKLSQARTHSCL